MKFFITLLGIILGITICIIILSSYHEASDKIKEISKSKKIKTKKDVEITNKTTNTLRRAPGERICPLCGSKLTKLEPLYATEVITHGKKTILIYGCQYCYKDK